MFFVFCFCCVSHERQCFEGGELVGDENGLFIIIHWEDSRDVSVGVDFCVSREFGCDEADDALLGLFFEGDEFLESEDCEWGGRLDPKHSSAIGGQLGGLVWVAGSFCGRLCFDTKEEVGVIFAIIWSPYSSLELVILTSPESPVEWSFACSGRVYIGWWYVESFEVDWVHEGRFALFEGVITDSDVVSSVSGEGGVVELGAE